MQFFSEPGVERSVLIDAPMTAAIFSLVRKESSVAIVNPITAMTYSAQLFVSRPFEHSITFLFEALLVQRVTRASLAEEFFGYSG